MSLDYFVTLKWMVEMPALSIPIPELDSELITGITRWHPVFFFQTQKLEKEMDGAKGRFTYADGAYGCGFHQTDIDLAAEYFAQIGRCHPSSRSASNNQHFLLFTLHYVLLCILERQQLPAWSPALPPA